MQKQTINYQKQNYMQENTGNTVKQNYDLHKLC